MRDTDDGSSASVRWGTIRHRHLSLVEDENTAAPRRPSSSPWGAVQVASRPTTGGAYAARWQSVGVGLLRHGSSPPAKHGRGDDGC